MVGSRHRQIRPQVFARALTSQAEQVAACLISFQIIEASDRSSSTSRVSCLLSAELAVAITIPAPSASASTDVAFMLHPKPPQESTNISNSVTLTYPKEEESDARKKSARGAYQGFNINTRKRTALLKSSTTLVHQGARSPAIPEPIYSIKLGHPSHDGPVGRLRGWWQSSVGGVNGQVWLSRRVDRSCASFGLKHKLGQELPRRRGRIVQVDVAGGHWLDWLSLDAVDGPHSAAPRGWQQVIPRRPSTRPIGNLQSTMPITDARSLYWALKAWGGSRRLFRAAVAKQQQ